MFYSNNSITLLIDKYKNAININKIFLAVMYVISIIYTIVSTINYIENLTEGESLIQLIYTILFLIFIRIALLSGVFAYFMYTYVKFCNNSENYIKDLYNKKHSIVANEDTLIRVINKHIIIKLILFIFINILVFFLINKLNLVGMLT